MPTATKEKGCFKIGKQAGLISESYFSSLLYRSGLDYQFVDKYYDYLVNGIKVELKSCRITIKGVYKAKGKLARNGFRIGCFDFTNAESRQKIIDEDMWVALVVRQNKQCLFFGFVKGSQLDGSRYLSLHKSRGLKPITFNQWLKLNKIDNGTTRNCPYCGKEMIKEEI